MSAAGELASGVRAAERRAIARAITLVESRRREDLPLAEALLGELFTSAGRALRIGVTGAPGVGKSTLVDALGGEALARLQRVGVLAVDPTSRRQGGSVLGDRVRMSRLSRAPEAFVRSSPSGGVDGGLGRRSREALVVLEAAGYDPLLIETVGVGQGELSVVDVAELVVVVSIAGSGDDVQGMKRGLLEHADVVVFNKADGEHRRDAERARDELGSLLGWLRSQPPPVLAVSAAEPRGVDELFSALTELRAKLLASGELERRKHWQRRSWFQSSVRELVLERASDSELAVRLRELELAVERGELAPPLAARRFVER